MVESMDLVMLAQLTKKSDVGHSSSSKSMKKDEMRQFFYIVILAVYLMNMRILGKVDIPEKDLFVYNQFRVP
jgi:hypothetical protein